VQLSVVDAVEVGDLMHEGRVHLVAQLIVALAGGEMRLAVDDDAIRQLAGPVLGSFCEGEAVVQTQKIETAVLGAILDDEDHVVEPVDHLVGQPVELVDHELLECC